MYCTNCGKEIPDNSKFCGYCGAPTANAQNTQNQNTATLQDMQKKVREALNTAGEKAGQIYQENAPKVKEALNNAGEKAGQLYQENAPKVKEALNNAGTTINEKAQDVSAKISSVEPKKAKKTAIIAAAVVVCLAVVGLLGKMLFKKPELTVERFDELAEKLAEKLDFDYEESSLLADEEISYEYGEGLKDYTGFIANQYGTKPMYGAIYMEFKTASAARQMLSEMSSDLGETYLKEQKDLKNGEKKVYQDNGETVIIIRDGEKVLFCLKDDEAPKEFDEFIKELGY